jgi:homoserine dehydrogenase
MTTPFRLGIAGLGTVGAGVVKIVQTHGAMLAAKAGRPVEITAVSARDRGLERGIDLSAYAWEGDATRLAQRDDVDCVVEVIGGEGGPARALADQALAPGNHRAKHVVTANKALIAHHGHELAEAAEAAGVALRFEAGVAGGIPVLKGIGEGLAANAISRVFGVLNGTCNFILSEMEATEADYADVLAEAQRLGYAEADPAFDVGGIDAAHKLAILAALAFGTRIDFGGVVTEGIERITLADIRTARDMGFSIKLLGLARMHDSGLEQRVRPCMVAETTPIGALRGVTNAVVVEGDFVGKCVFTGPGAGEGPTASAILADVLDVARGVVSPAFGRPAASLAKAPRLQHGEEHSPYYLRFMLADRPGALAQITAALGEAGVSIHRMRQYGKGDPVPVVIETHDARRDAIDASVEAIAGLPVSLATPVAIRIEEV